MRFRTLTRCALASLAVLAACDNNDFNNLIIANGTALVRFVNATNTTISLSNAGVVGAGNAALAFGQSSACITVNTANPALIFTNSGNGVAIAGFNPAFASNGSFTIVAFTDANGNTQFATLNNAFTPATGQAGLRVFNAASGSGNVVLNSGGSALNGGEATAFGNSGTFFGVPTGSSTFTFNTGNGTPILASTGAVTLNVGPNSTAILGPAASGTAPLRAFVSTGC